jgi:hypothetical protein
MAVGVFFILIVAANLVDTTPIYGGECLPPGHAAADLGILREERIGSDWRDGANLIFIAILLIAAAVHDAPFSIDFCLACQHCLSRYQAGEAQRMQSTKTQNWARSRCAHC